MQRQGILFRGPGVLVGVLLLAILGTRFSRHDAHATYAPPAYSLTVGQGHLAIDSITGLRATLQRVSASTALPQRTIRLTFRISLRNAGRQTRFVRHGDIFVVDQSGQSYLPDSLPRSSGRIAAHRGIGLTVSISIPIATHWVEIEWNDGGSLLPPVRLAVVGIRYRKASS